MVAQVYSVVTNVDPVALATTVSGLLSSQSPVGGPIFDPHRRVFIQAMCTKGALDVGGAGAVQIGAGGTAPAALSAAPTASDFNNLVAQLQTAGVLL